MTQKQLLDPSLLWDCQILFTLQQRSLEEIYKETGVPVEVLEEWAKKYTWLLKKEEIAKAECDIQTDKILTRAQLLKKYMEEQDPQAVVAFSRLEALALKEAQTKAKNKKKPLSKKSKEEILEVLIGDSS